MNWLLYFKQFQRNWGEVSDKNLFFILFIRFVHLDELWPSLGQESMTKTSTATLDCNIKWEWNGLRWNCETRQRRWMDVYWTGVNMNPQLRRKTMLRTRFLSFSFIKHFISFHIHSFIPIHEAHLIRYSVMLLCWWTKCTTIGFIAPASVSASVPVECGMCGVCVMCLGRWYSNIWH